MIEKTDATAAGSSDNAKNVTGISDADLSAEITKTITKTVEDYNLANIKKNLSMTQVSEMIPTIFLLLKDILTKINDYETTCLLEKNNFHNTFLIFKLDCTN